MRDEADRRFQRFRERGEPEDLARVFDLLSPRLLLVAHHLAGSEVAAEDVLQDTFVRAIEVADRYDGSRRVLPWLIGIMAGEARNATRRARRRPDAERVAAAEPPIPPEVAAADEFQEALTRALDELDDRYRDVLTLRLIHGLAPTEIAHSLGKSPDTVKTRLRRGLELLRRALPVSFATALAVSLAPTTALAVVRANVLAAAATAAQSPANPPEPVAVPTPGAGWRPAKVGRLAKATAAAAALTTVGLTVWVATDGWGDERPSAIDSGREPVVVEEPVQAIRSVAVTVGEDESEAVAPPALPQFRGQVVDATGNPLADTEVELYRWAPDVAVDLRSSLLAADAPTGLRLRAGSSRTDDAGRFVIEGEWPRSLFLVRVGATVRIATSTPRRGAPVDFGRIALPRTGRLTGRIVDDVGKPVANARVRVTALGSETLARFPVHRLTDCAAILHARSAMRDAATEQVWQQLLALPAEPPGDTVLARPAWLEALLELLPIVEGTVDDGGRFEVAGLPRANYTLIVDAPGHGTLMRTRVVAESDFTRDLGTMHLIRPAAVTGRVFDAQGQAVANAEVLVAPVSRATASLHFARCVTTTDRRGGFSCLVDDAAEYVAAVRRDPSRPWSAVSRAARGEPFTLQDAAGFRLTFRVTSRAGEAVGSPKVQLLPGTNVEFGRLGYLPPLDLESRWDVDEDGQHTIEDVPAGAYVLLVDAANHETFATRVALDRDLEDSYFLESNPTYDVSVVDARLLPVRGAAVFARAVGDQPLAATVRACGSTDEDGRLRIRGIPGRALRLTAVHGEIGTGHVAFARDGQGQARIRLERTGRISGRLTDGDGPPQPEQWMVSMRPLPTDHAIAAATVFADVARDGGFRSLPLLVGDHEVTALHSLALIDDRIDVFRWLVGGDRSDRPVRVIDSRAGGGVELNTTHPDPVVVPEDEPADEPVVEPEPELAELTGTVRQADGVVVAGAVVELRGGVEPDPIRGGTRPVERSIATDRRGEFAFAELHDGRYEVVVRAASGRYRTGVDVVDGAVAPLDATLTPGVFVRGRQTPQHVDALQFIRQDRFGNWLDLDPPQVPLAADGGFGPIVLEPGRYQVTPGGLGVRAAFRYTFYVEVGTEDRDGLVVPRLRPRRSWPSGVVPKLPTAVPKGRSPRK